MAVGRSTLCKPENADIARIACMSGATNVPLAERFEVSRRTIDNWTASISDFSNAAERGREVADNAVVSALYAHAVGLKSGGCRWRTGPLTPPLDLLLKGSTDD
jgi:hypothetical protein